MKKTIVIKIGTNVLTHKDGELDLNLIHDIVSQICNLKEAYHIVLVSSGAVGAGKQYVGKIQGNDPSVKKQILASIGQPRLFQWYATFFEEFQQKIAQALITRNDFRVKESFFNIKNTLKGLLENDLLPIVNENDVVKNHLSTFGDNDQLAALTASLLEADKLIILSDVKGLYTSDPKQDPNAKIIQEVSKIDESFYAFCKNTTSAGGSGGMFSKLKAAEIACSHGIPTVLSYGKIPNIIPAILENQEVGTYFLPYRKKPLSTRGAWMNKIAEAQGSILIDEGASLALQNNKSLLAVGIRKVEGSFRQKDIIFIKNQNNEKIGVGIAKHDSIFLNTKIKENSQKGIIAIHKNDLYTIQTTS